MHLQYIQLLVDRLGPAMLDAAIKGTLLLALAAAICLVFYRLSAATRHLIWTFTLYGVIALPFLSALLPSWRIGPTWVNEKNAGTSQQPNHASGPHIRASNIPLFFEAIHTDTQAPSELTNVSVAADSPTTPSAAPVALRWADASFGIWLAGAFVAAMPIFLATILLGRTGGKSRKIDCPIWRRDLADAVRAVGVSRRVVL